MEQVPAVAEDAVVGPVCSPGTDGGDGDVVNEEHDRDEDGKAEPAVGDDLVDLIGGGEFPSVLFDIAVGDDFSDLHVTFVGDDGFGIVVFGRFHTCNDVFDRLLDVIGEAHRCKDFVISLKQFDGIPAALRLGDVRESEGFDLAECGLDIGGEGLDFRGHALFGHFHGSFGRFHDAGAFQCGDLHNGGAQLFGQFLDIDLVAVLFDDVHHVDGDDRRDAQLDDLCREVKVSFQVRTVDEVQDGIGMFP